jgi:hypothetical protein
MPRRYYRLLELAEDLQGFGGYLDTEDRKRLAEKRGEFRAELRVVVYSLYRENPDHRALRTSVSADLDRIAEANTHSAGAIAEVREALLSGIRARAHSHPAVHILIRWGPPALAVVVIGLYIYLKVHRL